MNALFGLVALIAAIVWLIQRARRRPYRDEAAQNDPPFALEARGGDLIEAVTDPRIAAAGVMAAVARLEGELSDSAWRAIRVECRATFRTDQRDADDIAAGGRWLAEQFEDQDALARDLTAKLHDLAPREAHEDMVGMLRRVTEADGGAASAAQIAAIHRVMKDLDLV